MQKLPNESWPKFKFSPLKKKLILTLHPLTKVQFSPALASLLGFSSTPFQTAGNKIVNVYGNSIADMESSVHALYVYTDVVEAIRVGDTQAPLLRVVDASGAIGEHIHRNYNPPRYLPICKSNFDSIEIDIRTDEGKPVPFESGRLSVTLHFRRAVEPMFVA